MRYRESLRTAFRRGAAIKGRFVRRLLSWFRDNARSFPWRETTDPYEILVAELMLQRTQAAQVVESYVRFLRDYPTAASAGALTTRKLRAYLAPLGLAKRVPFIKGALSHILQEYGGEVPRTYDELSALPGVGPYTANAVRCFAYGSSAALVDANIVRILTRVLGIRSRKRLRTDAQFAELAGTMLATTRPREYNWAMIDLGAAVCTRTPHCSRCPLSALCEWAVCAEARDTRATPEGRSHGSRHRRCAAEEQDPE